MQRMQFIVNNNAELSASATAAANRGTRALCSATAAHRVANHFAVALMHCIECLNGAIALVRSVTCDCRSVTRRRGQCSCTCKECSYTHLIHLTWSLQASNVGTFIANRYAAGFHMQAHSRSPEATAEGIVASGVLRPGSKAEDQSVINAVR